MSDWPVEIIPDEDALYRRAHEIYLAADGVQPAAFKADPKESDRISVDWARYSTPQQSRARAKKPEKNAVVQLNAGDVRSLLSLAVEHTPIVENRSHSDIVGESTRARVELARICKIAIPLG